MENFPAFQSEIHNHPFLSDASDEFVKALSQFDDVVRFAPGEIILKENAYADAFYLILEGIAELGLDREPPLRPIILQELNAGDVLGWSWLYPPFRWNFTAQAKTACTMVRFDAPALLRHTKECPTFGYELMQRLGYHLVHRLQKTRDMLIRERVQNEVWEQENKALKEEKAGVD